jgi:hypothetical protein
MTFFPCGAIAAGGLVRVIIFFMPGRTSCFASGMKSESKSWRPRELKTWSNIASRESGGPSWLLSHWKLGEEVSDERRVDGRLPKGHVAASFAAGRNKDELSVSDALLSTIDDPEFWRV